MTFNYTFESHWFKSPGYLRCKVPECVKEELEKTISDVQNNLIQVDDFREKLAGHLEKETSLPITPNIKYLVESMSCEYDNIFRSGKHAMHETFGEDMFNMGIKYELTTLWINYAKKYDFNPIHHHSGVYSFVIWVKIPYDLEKELKKYNPTRNITTSFNFISNSSLGEIISEKIDVIEWDMIFFPAKLEHCVYPFYTSDDYRISISGNIFANLKE